MLRVRSTSARRSMLQRTAPDFYVKRRAERTTVATSLLGGCEGLNMAEFSRTAGFGYATWCGAHIYELSYFG